MALGSGNLVRLSVFGLSPRTRHGSNMRQTGSRETRTLCTYLQRCQIQPAKKRMAESERRKRYLARVETRPGTSANKDQRGKASHPIPARKVLNSTVPQHLTRPCRPLKACQKLVEAWPLAARLLRQDRPTSVLFRCVHLHHHHERIVALDRSRQ